MTRLEQQQAACGGVGAGPQRGAHKRETMNLGFLPRAMAEHIVIASAAAVPSSSRDELDMGMPVRSDTIVWKLSSDSKRPCRQRWARSGEMDCQPQRPSSETVELDQQHNLRTLGMQNKLITHSPQQSG